MQSNLDKEMLLKIRKEKLSSILENGDWMTKMEIQDLMFSGGIYYDRQNDKLFTNR